MERATLERLEKLLIAFPNLIVKESFWSSIQEFTGNIFATCLELINNKIHIYYFCYKNVANKL